MSPKPDRLKDYLRNMMEAIDRATLHIADIASLDDFEIDLKASDALVRCVEIIGEAATKLPKSRQLSLLTIQKCHGSDEHYAR